MADDTISKIKFRLNNNSRLKQTKNSVLSALNNRMSATDYSACNDFFANCCNCCGPGCDCCPCLSGFFITVSGWEDGPECTCTGLNGGPVWAPRHTYDTDLTKTCDQAGQVPGFQTFGSYVCPPSSVKNTSLEWTVFCENGKLWLHVITNSNLSYSLGGALSTGIIAELLVEVLDCDSLAVDEIVACQVGSGSPDCICPAGIRIQTFPIFNEQLYDPYPPLPEECLCCRPERCESTDVGCLNPWPETLTINIVDNCSGAIITTLTRDAVEGELGVKCWTGIYGTVCEECVGDDVTEDYLVEISLCCVSGNWTFTATVISPDNCVPFSWKTDPEAVSDATALMEISSCDPMTLSSLEANCAICEWRTCIPIQNGSYCITSFTITE